MAKLLSAKQQPACQQVKRLKNAWLRGKFALVDLKNWRDTYSLYVTQDIARLEAFDEPDFLGYALMSVPSSWEKLWKHSRCGGTEGSAFNRSPKSIMVHTADLLA